LCNSKPLKALAFGGLFFQRSGQTNS
jgi:hypothetical protein